MDHRAGDDAERINTRRHEALRYVGGKISPEMHAPKLAWLARCKPETIAPPGISSISPISCRFAPPGRLPAPPVRRPASSAISRTRSAGRTNFSTASASGSSRTTITRASAPRWLGLGAPLGQGLTAEAAAAMALAARDTGRRGAGRRSRRRRGHAGRARRGRRAGRSAPASGSDSGHVVELHGACRRAAVHRRDLGAVISVRSPPINGSSTAVNRHSAERSITCCACIQPLQTCRRARGRSALDALEKEIVARAGGLSRAALIAEDLHVLPDFIGSRSPSADAGARGGVMGMDLREDGASLAGTLCGGPLRPRLWPLRHRAQA